MDTKTYEDKIKDLKAEQELIRKKHAQFDCDNAEYDLVDESTGRRYNKFWREQLNEEGQPTGYNIVYKQFVDSSMSSVEISLEEISDEG